MIPDINSKEAAVQIKTLIKNETTSSQTIMLSSKIFDEKNSTVGSNELKVDLTAGSEKEISQNIKVNNPLLWSSETPNLYLRNFK